MSKNTFFTVLASLSLLTFSACSGGGGGGSSSTTDYLNEEISCVTDAAASLLNTCLKEVLSQEIEYKNLRAYEPTYQLYANGASKKRWIYLPVGTQIDTSNPDAWVFPVGTILWKEFSLAGKKIETRKIEKLTVGTGNSSWSFSSYLWREDQTDADPTTDGIHAVAGVDYERVNHISDYTVPALSKCTNCHQGAADTPLGFNYLQLSNNHSTGLSLSTADVLPWLTQAPTTLDEIAGDATAKAALGYLHANCAHCHSPAGLAQATFHMNHVSGTTTVTAENAYANTVNVGATVYVTPHDLANSYIYQRVTNSEMPPDFAFQKHGIDATGLTILSDWILSL